MMRQLGPDTGQDSIGDFSQGKALAKFSAGSQHADQLAKTILYNLNPADNEMMATMISNFNDGDSSAKVQFGSALVPRSEGRYDQTDQCAEQHGATGVNSLGMLTDSRSFLSARTPEYFRRILCNLFW